MQFVNSKMMRLLLQDQLPATGEPQAVGFLAVQNPNFLLSGQQFARCDLLRRRRRSLCVGGSLWRHKCLDHCDDEMLEPSGLEVSWKSNWFFSAVAVTFSVLPVP